MIYLDTYTWKIFPQGRGKTSSNELYLTEVEMQKCPVSHGKDAMLTKHWPDCVWKCVDLFSCLFCSSCFSFTFCSALKWVCFPFIYGVKGWKQLLYQQDCKSTHNTKLFPLNVQSNFWQEKASLSHENVLCGWCYFYVPLTSVAWNSRLLRAAQYPISKLTLQVILMINISM